MKITYTLLVPPDVAADPDRIIPWIQARMPTSVLPDAITATADRPSGLSLSFSLDYPSIPDAKAALSIFFHDNAQLPEPPTP